MLCTYIYLYVCEYVNVSTRRANLAVELQKMCDKAKKCFASVKHFLPQLFTNSFPLRKKKKKHYFYFLGWVLNK